jgi:hypothetical protein
MLIYEMGKCGMFAQRDKRSSRRSFCFFGMRQIQGRSAIYRFVEERGGGMTLYCPARDKRFLDQCEYFNLGECGFTNDWCGAKEVWEETDEDCSEGCLTDRDTGDDL